MTTPINELESEIMSSPNLIFNPRKTPLKFIPHRITPTAPTPRGRGGHQMVAINGTDLLICGGWSGTEEFDDTALFQTDRGEFVTEGPGLGGMPARSCHRLVVARAHQTVYMYGRSSSRVRGEGTELWHRTPTDGWSMIHGRSGHGGPTAACDVAMAYIPTVHGVLVVGGTGSGPNSPVSGGAYLYDIEKSAWSSLPCSGSVDLQRASASAFYDSVTDSTYLIGGRTVDNEDLRDVVAIQHGKQHTVRVVSRAPVCLGFHCAAFDEENRMIFLSVAIQNVDKPDTLAHNEIWTFDLTCARWSQIMTSTTDPTQVYPLSNLYAELAPLEDTSPPHPRTAHQLAYVPSKRSLYIYGGIPQPGTSATTTRLDDMWQLELVSATSGHWQAVLRSAVRRQVMFELCATSSPTPDLLGQLADLFPRQFSREDAGPVTVLPMPERRRLAGLAAREVGVADVAAIYPGIDGAVPATDDVVLASRLHLLDAILYHVT